MIICRHGRTFTDDEAAYDLGPTDDPRLTVEGIRQAIAIGKSGFIAKQIFCGPMQRHVAFATIIALYHTAPVSIDTDLNEGGNLDLDKYPDESTLIITSNGVLRKFHGPMQCGNYGIVTHGQVRVWDVKP